MAKRHGSIVVTSVDSVAVWRYFNKLPKDIQAQIRKSNLTDARDLKGELERAPETTPQQKLVQKAIYAKQDRVIRVDIGGKKRVGRQYNRRKQIKTAWGVAKSDEKIPWRAPAGTLVYGSEYGSSGNAKDRTGRLMGNRFGLPNRKAGYWISPTMRRFSPYLISKWEKRIQRSLDRKAA